MKKNELLDENLTLRKKVERLTTKNRSLEVLSDDLKSENKTLKSNLIKQEIQINSVVNVMKAKNDLLEAKDAMIETLKSQRTVCRMLKRLNMYSPNQQSSTTYYLTHTFVGKLHNLKPTIQMAPLKYYCRYPITISTGRPPTSFPNPK